MKLKVDTRLNPYLNEAMLKLLQTDHYDPHQLLGLHTLPSGEKVIRLWRPGAQTVYLEVFGEVVEAKRTRDFGIFEYIVPEKTTFLDYRIYHTNGMLGYDPYAFWPSVGDMDLYLFGQGTHYHLYNVMGGRLVTHQGVKGVRFLVWAPSARGVAVIADFNYWDGRVNPLRALGSSGVWELFVPGLQEGEKYKFEIKTQTGKIVVKSDPYALSSELRPLNASIVSNVHHFAWNDDAWIERRRQDAHKAKPISIYEVHLGSWKKGPNGFLPYQDCARELVTYCRTMGFTHVELLPIQEHPLDESWGYQVSGFYAVTSRFGTPNDFQWFVNHLHENGIGIILDWVPGHFPTDEFSLGRFDGTALYEHEDPKQGFHPHWKTYIFNFGRHEVSNFLIANALYWLDVMHVDGLRVDAVASMLYLDYGREHGEWIPNRYGTKENLEAIEFFKHLNSIAHERFPGTQMIAEESTSFTGVTHPVQHGGLGFDMKWNMGWMNDTLRYFSTDMLFRHYHQNDLTFGLLYAFTERFCLVFSHDEVVHGKNSLMGKMPGDVWQQFANMRLLYSYMMCMPGKKLLFMGGEIGQWNEWNCKSEIEWGLLSFPIHSGLQTMVREINHLYLDNANFWEKDFDWQGFEWVDFSDSANCVIAYLRKSSQGQILCVHNFTPTYHGEYIVRIGGVQQASELFNSDDERYGGTGKKTPHPYIMRSPEGQSWGLRIQLSPLATMVYEISY